MDLINWIWKIMPSKKKTLNYFERQQKKLHPKKYRFYFFEYMYYCGEKWGEKSFRISGMIVFFSYWSFCFVLPLSLYLSSISVLSHTDGWHIVGVMAFGIIPPVLFCILRYRSGRRSALMRHYRQSIWHKGIPVWLICSAWFPLLIVEFWVIKEMGWI